MAWTAPMTFTAGAVLTAAQLNTHLRDNLTELRAGGLGLSSQAAVDLMYASSATQWTRLAKGSALQTLRVNSGATALEWADMSAIKSIQHGSTSIAGGSLSATTSITSVSTAKAFMLWRSQHHNAEDPPQRLELTNSTTVTVYKNAMNNGGTYYWTVVEFN